MRVSVRKPRLPKLTPRIGMSRPDCAMRVAMLSSVPSPPSTTTRSTCAGQFVARAGRGIGRVAGERGGLGLEDGLDVPVAAATRASRSRWSAAAAGRAWRRCRRARWGRRHQADTGARAGRQVEEELDVALLAGDRRRGRRHAPQSYLSARGRHLVEHARVDRRRRG